jgi:hypothetical protein
MDSAPCWAAFPLAATVAVVPAAAQPDPVQPAPVAWRHTLAIDLLGCRVDGEIRLPDGSRDAASNTGLGGMVSYRADNGAAAFLATLSYLPWSTSGQQGTPPVYHTFALEANQLTVDIDYAWRAGRVVEFFVGGRFTAIRSRGDATSYFPGEGWHTALDSSKRWLDPVLGFQGHLPLGRSVAITARADLGGFNVSSEEAWQLQATLEVQLSRPVAVRLGYRAFSITDGADLNDPHAHFLYDIRTSGPLLGVSIAL